ncbi:MAG: hypothetical protein IH921_04010 [Gemmatimonadetes bacterium]|nr:hypothetical protein [Gemmatimonadota bacterium]
MVFGTLVHALVLGGDVITFEGKRSGSPWASFKGLIAGEDHFVFNDPHRGKAWTVAKEEAAGRLHAIRHEGEWYHVGTLDELAAAESAMSGR